MLVYKKSQHWWIATGTEAAVRFLFEETLQMSSNKWCLTVCNTWHCETPLKDSSVRAHLFSWGRSNEPKAARGGGSTPGLRGAGCAARLWAGFLGSEGQVAALMCYRAWANELTRLLAGTWCRCGTPAPGHELSAVECSNAKWTFWMKPPGHKMIFSNESLFPLKISNQLFQSPVSLST